MAIEWIEEQSMGDIASYQSNELLLKAAANTVTTFSCYLTSRSKVNKDSHRPISASTPYQAQEQRRSYILNSWKQFF